MTVLIEEQGQIVQLGCNQMAWHYWNTYGISVPFTDVE